MADSDVVTAGSGLENLTIGFIGCGKMAQAIIKGVIKSGLTRPENIMGSAVQDSTLQKLKALGIRATLYNTEVAAFSRVLVVAVKPHLVTKVIGQVKDTLTKVKLVISVAAGVTLDTLQQAVPEGVPVIRVMPSLPASVGCGTSAICLGTHAQSVHGDIANAIFTCCGFVETVPESYIDIVTAVCASMIGCVTIEAMSDGAVKMGLPRALATRLAAQSLMGAAKLVTESGDHPAAIKDAVCSPGGTTIAGLHRLEAGGYRAAAMDAIEAATLRARELGAKK